MEEAGILAYIGNLVIGFTPERYIGNPVIRSCCSELGQKECRQQSQTCTISHHIIYHVLSHLVLVMTYSTCCTDARATSVTNLHDLQAGNSRRVVRHNHHIHVIGSRKSNTQVYYINIGLGRGSTI